MLKKHQRVFNKILIVIDTLTLIAAYFAAYLIKLERESAILPKHIYFNGLLWMIPVIIVVYFFMDVYTPMRSRLYRKEALLIIRAHMIGLVIVYSIFFLQKAFIYSREMLTLFGVLGILFMLIERYIIRKTFRYLRKIGYNQRYMVIVGAGKAGANFARKVSENKDFGYNVIGFLDDALKQDEIVMGKPVLGCCTKLSELLSDNSVDEVVVALPLNACCKYSDIIEDCEKAGVRVRFIPDFTEFIPGNPKIEEFDGIPLMNVRHIPLDEPLNRILKRLIDIVFSLVTIMVTSPIMVLIALGIKLSSKGPVFFRQERIGQSNRPFNMLKFRTMREADDDSACTTWTTPNDPRKTKFGSFLRKTSLDELPQFFNVLLGNMSIVGPRPERPFFVEQFKEQVPKYMVKHQVKPGITGWAQVNGWRGDTSIEKRIECDIYYIENWDLFFDFKIMFLTLFKGLMNSNAY